MAKEIVAHIKLQIPAGQANPAPPVGTALGPRGVNIMAFCKEFNATTQKQAGDILPVVITVYKDKSFTFITKSPPAAILLKKAAGIAAGSKEPNKTKVGKVTRKQIMEIVKTKGKDLNSRNDEAGFRIILKDPTAGDDDRVQLALLYCETGQARAAIDLLRSRVASGDEDMLNAYGVALADGIADIGKPLGMGCYQSLGQDLRFNFVAPDALAGIESPHSLH